MNFSKLHRAARLATAVFLLGLPWLAHAAPGDFDIGFGGSGKILTQIGSGADTANAIALQNDGKIIVAGTTFNGANNDIALARYTATGQLDTTFNGTGKVTTPVGSGNDYGQSVAVQGDGKILVAGYTFINNKGCYALMRYTSTGTLDSSFNGSGIVTTSFGGSDDRGASVTVQNDGKILVAGRSFNGSNNDFSLLRYTSSGALDTTFNGTGIVTTPVRNGEDEPFSVAVQTDGKIVVGGYSNDDQYNQDVAVVRYTASGTLDSTFNATGIVVTPVSSSADSALSLTLQADGKILVTGFTRANDGTNDIALLRYTGSGMLDPSFNGSGIVTTAIGSSLDVGYDVAVQADGKILVAGNSVALNGDFALVRYTSSGALDRSFNGTGKVTAPIGSSYDSAAGMVIQSDGKILIAGTASNGNNDDFALARFNTMGWLDLSFQGSVWSNNIIPNHDEYAEDIAIQRDGKILVAGCAHNGSNYDFALLRYTPAGSLDSTFNGTGMVTTPIGSGDDFARGLAIQDDGKILVIGYANGTRSEIALARFTPAGVLDTSFNGSGKVTTSLGISDAGLEVAVQADGKIVVAGTSLQGGSNWDFSVLRYTSSGALDTSFNGKGFVTTATGPSDEAAQAIAIQADGKIVVAGYSNNGSNYDFGLLRYTSSGVLDSSLNGTGIVTTAIGSSNDWGNDVVIQGDGKILVLGRSDDATSSRCALARYTSSGSLDTTFNGSGLVLRNGGEGRQLAIQTNGKILVAGSSSASAFSISRYTPSGSPDSSFRGTGEVTFIGDARGLAIQSDGRIVGTGDVQGASRDIFVMRIEGDRVDSDGDGIFNELEDLNGDGNLIEHDSDGDSIPDYIDADDDNDGIATLAEDFNHDGNWFNDDTDLDGIPNYRDVTPPPPTATTGITTNISNRGARVTGTVNANGLTTNVYFEFGLTTSYGGSLIASPALATGTSASFMTADLSSLTPATIYHYRVTAVSAGGIRNGVDRVFITANNQPPSGESATKYFGSNATAEFEVADLFSDPDGDALTFSGSVFPPNNLTLTQPTATSFRLTVNQPTQIYGGKALVTIRATDAWGASVENVVTVIDTIPPSLVQSALLPEVATGATGTALLPDLLPAFTATDNVGVFNFYQLPPPGTVVAAGETLVTVYAQDDGSGHPPASVEVHLDVVDGTNPVVTAPVDLTIHASSPQGAIVTFAPTATDNVAVTSLTTFPESGTLFPVGTTTVVVSASDAANNTSTDTFTVTVTPLTTDEAWRYQYFGTSSNSGIAAMAADPDGDGQTNLIEFAFGTDPSHSASGVNPLVMSEGQEGTVLSSRGQPIVVHNAATPSAIFCRRIDASSSGLTYTAQFTADLTTWQESVIIPEVVADDGTYEAVRVAFPTAMASGTCFVRVQITSANP